MTKSQRQRLSSFLSNFERETVERLVEKQSTQSFYGALKVNADRVYVDRDRGRSALRRLSRLSSASALPSK